MKKRLLGIITAVALLAGMPVNSAYSADEEKNPLREFAKQLGWETDYFTFANFSTLVSNKKTEESYLEYLNTCTNAEIVSDPFDNYYNILKSGRCMGISTLEVLSHNGIIKPSDIQPGSESLTDITLDNNVKDVVAKYHLLQNNTELDLYMKWYLTHYGTEEKVKMLLDTAERSMEEGKYFLMVYDSPGVTSTSERFIHAVAGIGIADGNWTFNDEQYDKCILTYDSNVIKEEFLPQKTIAWGFHENVSVYVNTEKNKLYVPGYDIGTDDGLTFFATDDETLLNYKGSINPSETVNTDLSLLNKIKIEGDGEYSITAKRPDQTSYDVIADSFESYLTKNTKSYYFDGHSVVVENVGGAELDASITDTAHTVNINVDGNVQNIFKDASTIEITGSGENASYSVDIILNEGNYEFSPHYRWKFDGVTDSDISVKQTDKGILLSSGDVINCKVTTYDAIYNEEDSVKDMEGNCHTIEIISPENVMVYFDENDELKYDEVTSRVTSGDVNNDNLVDASDASYVLAEYANLSTGGNGTFTKSQKSAGDVNFDGKIDASDASYILGFYAYLSTGGTETNMREWLRQMIRNN